MNKFEKVTLAEFTGNKEIPSACDIAVYNSIKLPQRATEGSAGYDFFAPNTFTLEPNQTIKVATGIRVALDKDKVLMLFPRSSLGFKYRLRLNNTVGIVDSDYYYSDNQGHIFIKITNEGDTTLTVNQGDAFAQGIISKYYTTDDDDSYTKQVRNGGMGSTNNK